MRAEEHERLILDRWKQILMEKLIQGGINRIQQIPDRQIDGAATLCYRIAGIQTDVGEKERLGLLKRLQTLPVTSLLLLQRQVALQALTDVVVYGSLGQGGPGE
ncbi:MAG: hypothetical protein A2X22_09465 [Bacteroidetes bacterium GWF2_49_14]|nr:MAG: hypothetical protein A2X22_09465 [Bacteroidetes bacterium GWF2_49_14]